jgi:hypothetical protein
MEAVAGEGDDVATWANVFRGSTKPGLTGLCSRDQTETCPGTCPRLQPLGLASKPRGKPDGDRCRACWGGSRDGGQGRRPRDREYEVRRELYPKQREGGTGSARQAGAGPRVCRDHHRRHMDRPRGGFDPFAGHCQNRLEMTSPSPQLAFRRGTLDVILPSPGPTHPAPAGPANASVVEDVTCLGAGASAMTSR